MNRFLEILLTRNAIVRNSRFVSMAIIGASWLIVASFAYAQVTTDIEPPQPRFAAIGATVAMAGDPAMAFFNPAGLTGIKAPSFNCAFTRPYDQNFLTVYHVTAAMPLPKNWGVAGVSILNSGVKYGGQSLSNETAVALAHAITLQRDINTDLTFGYAIKVMSQSFGTSLAGEDLGSSTSFGIDAGVRATLWQRTRVAFHITNINRPEIGTTEPHDLPAVVNVGLAYTPYRGVYSAIELERTLGNEQLLKGGFEFEVDPHFDLRIGIRSNPNRIAFGFGIKQIMNAHVDYTYLTHSSLPATHMIGFGYDF